MIFQKRQDFLPSQTLTFPNGVARWEITREFHIESIVLQVDFTLTGAVTTKGPDGLAAVLKNVKLQISDGARTRNVVDVSGPGLLEYHMQTAGMLDTCTLMAINTQTVPTNGYPTRMFYPIWFSHPQLADPVGSALLLPAPRYNSNPVLTVTLGTVADVDQSAASAAFAASAGIKITPIINRRQVTVANWPTYDTELAELFKDYTATGNGQLYELQIPGSYTGILLRDYVGAAASVKRRSIQTPAGENRLQILGTVLRRFSTEQIQAENEFSMCRLWGGAFTVATALVVPWLFPPQTTVDATDAATSTPSLQCGSYYLDFLADKVGETAGELGSVLDANILQASGARIQLLQDITTAAVCRRYYLTHRIFGNLNAFKISSIRK